MSREQVRESRIVNSVVFGLVVLALAFVAVVAVADGAGPAASASGKGNGPVQVRVGPDPDWPKADPDTGERPEPYVLFQLKNAKRGYEYRIRVEEAPAHKPSYPCNSGLETQWEPAFGSGEVAFPPEPVDSGTYLPFAGGQPCKGSYSMFVQERKVGVRSWRTVRRFAFSYPSFRTSYVPLGH